MGIMLVEDDPQIHEMTASHIEKEGFRVISAFNGDEALRLFSEGGIDLVILDLMLPAFNGMEVLKHMRESSTVPILIMSAKDSDVDKALGLGFGADDYLGKPFSPIELTARIKALLRRSVQYSRQNAEYQDRTIRFAGLVIDAERYSVSKNGIEVALTAKEFRILSLMAANPSRVFTKPQLFESVWKEPYYGDENVINVHIRRIRGKIEDDPSAPKYIKTVWGIGYKLEVPS